MKTIEVSPEFISIVVKLHRHFKDDAKVAAWLVIDNPNLGGLSPRALINHNRINRVSQFIDNAMASNKPTEEVSL